MKCYVIPMLVATSLALCTSVHAQEGIKLQYVPEGTRLSIDGVDYIAYDLEGMKELARLEVRYRGSLKRITLLNKEVSLQTGLINRTEERVLELESRIQDLLDTSAGVGHDEPTFWDNTDHLIIEGALLSIALLLLGVAYHASTE